MNIKIEPYKGIFDRPSVRFDVQPARSKAGEYIELKAQMDLVVGLTACSHDRFNSGRPKPIGVQLFASQQNKRALNRAGNMAASSPSQFQE